MSSVSENGGDKLSRESIVKLLMDTDWPLATTEVADRFDETQQNTHYYLSKLAEEGRIEKRVVGGTAIWRLPS